MKKRSGLNLLINELGFNVYAKLYNTVIFTQKDNIITLNSGGYKTNHTKNCINDLLPNDFKLYQKNYDWFLSTPNGVIDFQDNIKLNIEVINE